MSDYCVVVVDGARARLFSLEPVPEGELGGGPNLVERGDLTQPEGAMKGDELWSNTKSGHNRGGSQAHAFDDHREQHSDEFRRRFARHVAEEAVRLTDSQHASQLVLAAEKRMLGFLREAFASSRPAGLNVTELAKDLSKLPTRDLHQFLAQEKLLPERRYEGAS